jgi:hypothetical protein
VEDRRIRVNTATRAIINSDERAVVVVGISSRTALVVAPEQPAIGSTLTLYLPSVQGDVEILAGVEHVDPTPAGFAIAVAFIVVDQATRQVLNDLMTLLLAGDGGGTRQHPRVIYDVAIYYGVTLSQYGRLEDLSLRGASLRIKERMLPGTPLRFSVPDFATDQPLVLDARVVQQRLSKEGGYHTGVEFTQVEPPLRARVARLLADLLCR